MPARRLAPAAVLAAALLAAGAAPWGASGRPADPVLVSRQSDAAGGRAANGDSSAAAISANGRFVAFQSSAGNLSRESGRRINVYVRDLRTGTTELVSRRSGRRGAGADGDSTNPSISGDGRYVAFESSARNLGPASRLARRTVFVRDRRRHTTRLVSRANGRRGAAADRGATNPGMSENGGFVVYESPARNLTRTRTHGFNVYVRDLRRARTILVSRADGRRGRPGYSSAQPSISASGRFVAFDSGPQNFVHLRRPGDLEVFVRDLKRGATTLVSRANGRRGHAAHGTASAPSISGDGRRVVFESPDDRLARGDRRGGFHIFVRDLTAHTTELVDRATGRRGRVADAKPECFSISPDGRYVVWESTAGNLSRLDRGSVDAAFSRDLRTNRTTLISGAPGGRSADNDSGCPSAAAHARVFAFESVADNLSTLDDDDFENVYARAGP